MTKNLDAGKTPNWAGTTPFLPRLRGQSDPWGRSSPAQKTQLVFCPPKVGAFNL